MELLVIANGKLQHGRARRRWNRAEERLKETFGKGVEILFTRHRGDATRYARDALLSGSGWIAAAGGDGTINEVVNGFFEKGRNIRPGSSLSILPCGSGNDYIKTLEIAPDLCAAVETLQRPACRTVDVGLARFRGMNGATVERAFVNVAEAGVGGRLLAKRGDWFLRSRTGYRLASLAAAVGFKPYRLQWSVDGRVAESKASVLSLIVAGGRYFGNGMQCAPMARPDDGLLEIIILDNFRRAEILMKIGTFFSGSYLDNPKVIHRSARTLAATSEDTVYLELDGELAGTLPATFTLLPGSLQIRGTGHAIPAINHDVTEFRD